MSGSEATDPRHQYVGSVIAVGGSPHSGKTVFLNALHDALLAKIGDKAFKEPVCPDGEGKWAAESDPEIVQRIRKKYPFSDEFMAIKLPGIAGLASNKQLVLLDLGGKRTTHNAKILEYSTDLLILSSNLEEFAPWEAMADSAGCRTIGHLRSEHVRLPSGEFDMTMRSKLHKTLGNRNSPLVEGCFYNLDRNLSNECYQEAIEELSLWLIEIGGHGCAES